MLSLVLALTAALSAQPAEATLDLSPWSVSEVEVWEAAVRFQKGGEEPRQELPFCEQDYTPPNRGEQRYCPLLDETVTDCDAAGVEGCRWGELESSWRSSPSLNLPTVSAMIPELLAGVALVVFLGVLLLILRRWRRERELSFALDEALEGPVVELPKTPVELLLDQARQAEAAGELARAAVLLHLAALKQLDQTGKIRFHASKTNREYRRALSAQPALAEWFSGVVAQVERHQYGDGRVERARVQDALQAATQWLGRGALAALVTLGAAGLSGCQQRSPMDLGSRHPSGLWALKTQLEAVGYEVEVRQLGPQPRAPANPDGAEGAGRAEGAEGAGGAEGAADAERAGDAEGAEGAGHAGRAADVEGAEGSENAERTGRAGDAEGAGRTEGTEDAGRAAGTEETPDAERAEDAEDAENAAGAGGAEGAGDAGRAAGAEPEVGDPLMIVLGSNATLPPGTVDRWLDQGLRVLLIDPRADPELSTSTPDEAFWVAAGLPSAPTTPCEARLAVIDDQVFTEILLPPRPLFDVFTARWTSSATQLSRGGLQWTPVLQDLDSDGSLMLVGSRTGTRANDAGCLLLMPNPDLLTNASLMRPRNAELVGGLMRALTGPQRRVVFVQPSAEAQAQAGAVDLTSLLTPDGLRPATLVMYAQVGLLLVALLTMLGVRFGLARDPPRTDHKRLVEHTQALGYHYAQAGDAGRAFAARRLARLLITRHRPRSIDPLAQELGARYQLPPDELHELLALGQLDPEAPTPTLKNPSRALELAARLLGRPPPPERQFGP